MTFFANEIFEFCVADGFGLHEVFSGFFYRFCVYTPLESMPIRFFDISLFTQWIFNGFDLQNKMPYIEIWVELRHI